MRCSVGHRHGSDLALLWLWHRPGAIAPIRPLAWEPPYALGATLKRHFPHQKCNSKLLGGTTSHLLEWPSLTNQQITNAGGGVEERRPSYTVGGNVNWYNHCGKQYGVLRKLNIELPHDPAIPLLGIYPDKTFLEKDTCTCMFIAALFTIAKKQPKCPSTDDWIKKMWYIYTQWNTTQT